MENSKRKWDVFPAMGSTGEGSLAANYREDAITAMTGQRLVNAAGGAQKTTARLQLEVDINNSKHRAILIKRATHDAIYRFSNCFLSTRGVYIAPGRTLEVRCMMV
jgi:hypothetical protein